MLTGSVRGGSAGYLTSRATTQTKEAGGFAAALESSMKDKRTARQPAAAGDSITLQSRATVGWDYQEKLDYLAKLNAETDWGSMTDVEKVRTFEDRYREMFGMEALTILYTGVSKERRVVYENYLEECGKYFNKGGAAELKSRYQDCYRQAYYGNISDEELRAAIRDRHQGEGTMESKYLVLNEYRRAGVGTSVDDKVQDKIKYQIYKKAEDILGPSVYGTNMRVSQHPRYGYLFMSFAKGVGEGSSFRPGWAELANGVLNSYRNADPEYRMSEAELEQLQRELDEFLNEMVG